MTVAPSSGRARTACTRAALLTALLLVLARPAVALVLSPLHGETDSVSVHYIELFAWLGDELVIAGNDPHPGMARVDSAFLDTVSARSITIYSQPAVSVLLHGQYARLEMEIDELATHHRPLGHHDRAQLSNVRRGISNAREIAIKIAADQMPEVEADLVGALALERMGSIALDSNANSRSARSTEPGSGRFATPALESIARLDGDMVPNAYLATGALDTIDTPRIVDRFLGLTDSAIKGLRGYASQRWLYALSLVLLVPLLLLTLLWQSPNAATASANRSRNGGRRARRRVFRRPPDRAATTSRSSRADGHDPSTRRKSARRRRKRPAISMWSEVLASLGVRRPPDPLNEGPAPPPRRRRRRRRRTPVLR